MFAKPNPFDDPVTNATDENLTSENWDSILLVCEKATRSGPEGARDCIAALQKRLGHRNANVQLYALALGDALIKNCDINVHREISSRAFTNTLTKMIRDRTTHEKVRTKALELIQTCSFEFRGDSSLGLMNDVYHSLRAEGVAFPNPQKPKKEFTQSELDKQKEEEELQLALALSLSESENKSAYRASSSRAGASSAASTTTTGAVKSTTDASAPAAASAASAPASQADAEPKVSRVRALYDFQPTEQGELGFQKGDILRVIESVYRDWWKGELRGKTGIFPVNYVEKIVDPTPADLVKEAQNEADVMAELHSVDRLLDILNTIDPTKDSFSDNDELQTLYNRSLAIRPKLVSLIEKYSLKKDELVALNDKFLNARSIYDRMLNDSISRYSTGVPVYNYNPPAAAYGAPGFQQPSPQQQAQQPQQANFGNAAPSYPPNYQQAPPVMSPQLQQQQPVYNYQQPQQQPQPQPQSQPLATSPQLHQQQPVYQAYDQQQQYQQPPPLQQQQQQQHQHVPTTMSPQQSYGQAVLPPTTPQVQHQQTYAAPQQGQHYPQQQYAPTY